MVIIILWTPGKGGGGTILDFREENNLSISFPRSLGIKKTTFLQLVDKMAGLNVSFIRVHVN